MSGLLLIRRGVGTGEILRALGLILECAEEGSSRGSSSTSPSEEERRHQGMAGATPFLF